MYVCVNVILYICMYINMYYMFTRSLILLYDSILYGFSNTELIFIS